MKKEVKDILVLCDGEEEYAGLMTDFLKLHKEIPWEIRTYTAVEVLLQKEKKTEIAVLVAAESAYTDELKQLRAERVVILNESGILQEEGIWNINKYQSADKVLKELLEVYADIAKVQLPRLAEGYKTKIIGIYTPIRRCYQTTFSLTMGQLLAEKGKTLYLNFEYYAGVPELLPDMHTRDLADLLYFLNSEKEKFQLRMQSILQQKGKMDYIPPMKSGRNLPGVTVAEWRALLQKIMDLEEYEYVVLDLSEGIQGLWEILRLCARIYTLVQEERVAKCKLMQYEQLLELYEYEDVLRKSSRCNFPKVSKVPEEIEEYTKAEFARYVRKLIQEFIGAQGEEG